MTTSKDTSEPLKATSKKTLVVRLSAERKRQLRMFLAGRGQSFQAFMEGALDTALARATKEKN